VVIHESNEKSLYELSNLTGFTGADLVVEASGVPSAQSLAIDVTGMNGRVLFMGLTHKKANDVSLYQVQNRNLRLLSSTGAPSHIWAPTLEFLSRTNLDLTPIVSDVYAFNECEMAINSARQSSLHAKIVLSPDGK
jgi:L-iditol 2-dehydrogenase